MAKNDKLTGTINKLVKKYHPYEIQRELAKQYDMMLRYVGSGGEEEYWIKISKSSRNLASGMEKWLDELIEELEES